MHTLKKIILVGSLFFVSAVADWSSAWAQEAWVTALYQPVPGGYRYYLTVYNNTDPQDNRYLYRLDVFLSGGFDLESPDKWDYTDIQPWWVLWATDESSGGGWSDGIPPAGSLSGFNVTTPNLVSSFYYRAGVFNAGGGMVYTEWAYPELIPEPSSVLVLATGLAAAPFRLRRRRGR